MIQHEFVPYEQAIQLKELGFDLPSISGYSYPDSDKLMANAILFQQAFRWFREKHNLLSYISLGVSEEQDRIGSEYDEYCYVIEGLNGLGYDNYDYEFFFKTYEQAELACLKKLIEIVKQKP